MMPRYFFDTFDDGVLVRDTEGMDVLDRQAARQQAIKTLPYMALDALPDGPRRELAVEVRDEAGVRIFRAELVFRSAWLPQGQEGDSRPPVGGTDQPNCMAPATASSASSPVSAPHGKTGTE